MSVVYFDAGNLLPGGNKGDELMLHVTSSKLRSILPEAEHAIRPGATSFEERCQLKLKQLIWPRRLNRLSGNIGHFVLNRYRHQIGLVSEEDLTAVVNFAGYRYADFGCRETKIDAKLSNVRYQRGVKHIYLPQAYGPFHSQETKVHARSLFTNADLVFARDRYSEEYVSELMGGEFKIGRFPDITIGMSGEESVHDIPRDFMVLVPNHWMFSRAKKEDQSTYSEFIHEAIKVSMRLGLEVVILNHSPDQDQGIVDELLSAYKGNERVRYIPERDPIRLKGIVEKARFLVGSRYHAIVAALSQNVPAIGTSWSKKYQGLYSDYGVDELLVAPSETQDRLANLLEKLLEGAGRQLIVDNLNASNVRFRSQLDEMWGQVSELLRSESAPD
jgi:polysaccharide pyruvyl transferase WcaK-like protein